ncbi:MAG TPA: ATP-binding cassette domain-containing protein [Steroidobacteraceae bacterium]|nr:ATP-binding cassette domain-containing protein [Steroidobacteraceae bacterium]
MSEASALAPVVSARELTRAFRSTLALDRISFEIAPGEIFGVVGADGSGKTTLLQMLAAILDPTAGACQVLGFDTVRQANEVTARIGYMSQGFTLYERLTVEENLAFAAGVRSVDRSLWRERRERLLKMAGLEPFTQRRAGHLSGGMKKKLALCTNLIHEPRVLLLDEPSLGVDPLSRRELWVLLEDFRRQGAAIVLATSYMDEAERCDRVLFLHEGRALALGSPAQLKAQVAGRVFEVATAETAVLEERLAAEPAVRGFARLPDKIRFQLDRALADVPSLQDQLHDARPAVVELQDLFAAVAPAGAAAKVVMMPWRRNTTASAGTVASNTVRARNVTCRFGDFIAVNDVSLDLKPGEVFGFLGPNGAGKTTLIRILCGLQPFQTGEVEVAGVDVRREAKRLRSRIGYMSQRFSLYPDLTVMENLEFFAGVYALEAVARTDALNWAVETAGLYGLGHRKVSEISGAVRQRLALACSVMHRPQVLFLDEPTSGVDPLSRHRFWRLVHTLAAEGITAFVTTHYMEEAAYCHRLGLMLQGRLIALGPIDELRAREQLPQGSGVEELFLHYIERARKAA